MLDVGADTSFVLPDGRTLEYWDGGDPQGRAVIMHPGTPATRVLGRFGHQSCVERGVRLISLSRPGYGGSTPITTQPSLLQTGRDTVALVQELEITEYAVMGISGGGPFACATAVVDPDSVRAVALVGPVGPWRIADDPSVLPEERRQLEALDAGDLEGARRYFLKEAQSDLAGLADLDDDGRVDLILESEKDTPTGQNVEYRAVWAMATAVLLQGLEGYAFDNLAWGGSWDIDPSAVTAPTLIWDAMGDAARNGPWYAEHMAGSTFVTYPGEGHVDVCDGHWPEVIDAIVSAWS